MPAIAIVLGLGLVIAISLSGISALRADTEPPAPPPQPPPQPPVPLSDVDVQSPVSPGLLEKKRLIVRNGFVAAENRRAQAFARARVKESIQDRKNAVYRHFRKMGIVTTKPDPTHPFWHQSRRQIADKVARAVNTVPGPGR